MAIATAPRSASLTGPIVDITAAQAKADTKTENGEGSVYPQPFYLVATVILVVAGVFIGTYIFDNLADGVTFTPPTGISILAVFFIMAQVIERLQEPFTPFVKGKDADDKSSTQKQAKGELEKAVASGTSDDALQDVANKKRLVDQIRANTTVLLFGTSALAAMLLSGYLKARLMDTVGVDGIAVWVDIAMTGLVVAAGTKPLHDLISNLQETKEKKQDPPGTK
jgi:hypothetical protein